MNKSISYKQKIKFLIGGSILFLVIIYFGVLNRTLELYWQNKELQSKLTDVENAPVKKKDLKKKLHKFDAILSPYIRDSIKNREYILSVASEFCHKHHVVLKDFPEANITADKNFNIETNIIVAEGSYANLLKLVYEFEQVNKVARPVSVDFKKSFDFKTKREVLTLTLYLQNIILNNNEKAGRL